VAPFHVNRCRVKKEKEREHIWGSRRICVSNPHCRCSVLVVADEEKEDTIVWNNQHSQSHVVGVSRTSNGLV
jgi:hypothetical protein